MGMSKSLKAGEQLTVLINTFDILTFRKEKIIDSNALLDYSVKNEKELLKCMPSEEHIYKSMEKLIESVENSVRGF